MFSKIGQIMLYVNNQDEAVKFWTEKLGFTVIAEENNDQGLRWIEIAPKKVQKQVSFYTIRISFLKCLLD